MIAVSLVSTENLVTRLDDAVTTVDAGMLRRVQENTT